MGKNIYLFGITFLLLAILLIGTISAEVFTFDNVAKYNENGKIEIRNFFNLFNLGSTTSEIEISSNSKYALKNCYAEINVNLFKKNKLVDEFFFNEKGIEYKVFVQDGTHEDIPIWIIYDGKERENGNYNIRLEFVKNENSDIEWNGKFQGVKLKEDIICNSPNNNGLIPYYQSNKSLTLKEKTKFGTSIYNLFSKENKLYLDSGEEIK